MRRTTTAFLLAAGIGLAPARAAAQGFAAGEFLRIPLGARTAAMGAAATGYGRDAFSIALNPATAAFLDRSELAVERFDLFEDIVFQDGTYVTPLLSRSALGVSFRSLDYGEITYTVEGSLAGLGTFNASDGAASVSFAHRFGDRWALGAALQVARSELASFSADAVVFDLGAFYRTPWGFSFGIAGLHLGSGFKYIAVEESLPAEFRAGVGFHKEALPRIGTVSAAADLSISRGEVEGYIGGEVEIYDRLALRLGWDGSNDAGTGLVAGIGMGWEGLSLDYAYAPYGDLGGTHRFSGAYRFGGRRVGAIEEAPPPSFTPPTAVEPVPAEPWGRIPAAEAPFASPPYPAAQGARGVYLVPLEAGGDPAIRERWAATFVALVGAGDLVSVPEPRADLRVTLLIVPGGYGAEVSRSDGVPLAFYRHAGDSTTFARGLLDRLREVSLQR